MEAIRHTGLLMHHLPPAAGQPLELLVFHRRDTDWLQHLLGQWQRRLQAEQLQDLACIDRGTFRGSRKYLLEPRQLQIIDVHQRIVMIQNPCIQWPGMAVEALHHHQNGYAEAALLDSNTIEELIKAPLAGLDIELIQNLPIGALNGRTMNARPDVNTDMDFIGLRNQ